MIIEIVLASVLAMSIAYYLLNLTYKFKNTNEDIQQGNIYMANKILITKNIMNDLEKGKIASVTSDYNSLEFEFVIEENNEIKIEKRILSITNESGITKLKYGKGTSNSGIYTFDDNDNSYYEKELPSSLVIGNITTNYTGGISIVIPIQSLYDDNDYSIKLFADHL